MLFPTQQICQPTTRWPTAHSILLLEDFTLADRPSNFNAGRKPLESVGSTSCSGRTLNNKKASMGLATSVYDKLAMLLKHQQWINKHLSSVNEKRRRTMFFPRKKKKRFIQSVAQSLLPTKVAGGTLRDDTKNGCVADKREWKLFSLGSRLLLRRGVCKTRKAPGISSGHPSSPRNGSPRNTFNYKN